jgi:peptide-methionine (R)-S-oxide reductase
MWAAACVAGFSSVAPGQDPLDNAPLAPQSRSSAESGSTEALDSSTRAGDAKPTAKAKHKEKPEFIRKSLAEWRGLLSKYQFSVTREKATEPPFTGKYASGHWKGTFVCVCCDAAHVKSELFSANTKFDSGTGWPSFYQAFDNRAVQTAWDYSEAEPRVEVMCRRCGAHLGHVFDDGPPPTGMRFCVNSAAIKLEPAEPAAATARVAATGKADPKSKSKAKPKSDEKGADDGAPAEAPARSSAAAAGSSGKRTKDAPPPKKPE